MFSKVKKQTEGFTIIEVLIVLAIAGLIILIVFLAVPALQRNSRNTQRKNDVSSLAGTLQEELNNTNGTMPVSCTGASATCWVKNSKMSFFDNNTTNVSWTKQAAVGAGTNLVPATAGDRDKIVAYNGSKCNETAGATFGQFTATNATLRSVAIQYMVETSGTPVLQCQEL